MQPDGRPAARYLPPRASRTPPREMAPGRIAGIYSRQIGATRTSWRGWPDEAMRPHRRGRHDCFHARRPLLLGLTAKGRSSPGAPPPACGPHHYATATHPWRTGIAQDRLRAGSPAPLDSLPPNPFSRRPVDPRSGPGRATKGVLRPQPAGRPNPAAMLGRLRPLSRQMPGGRTGTVGAAGRAGDRKRDAHVVPSDETQKTDLVTNPQEGTAHPPRCPAAGHRRSTQDAFPPLPPWSIRKAGLCRGCEGGTRHRHPGRQARMPAARIRAATVVIGSPAGRAPSRGCQRP